MTRTRPSAAKSGRCESRACRDASTRLRPGVLPILIGRGTRIAEYLLDWDKEYRATLRLGETTHTRHARRGVGTFVDYRAEDEIIFAAISRFKGRIQQVPPMYPAVKIGGVPLYKAAREAGLRTAQPE